MKIFSLCTLSLLIAISAQGKQTTNEVKREPNTSIPHPELIKEQMDYICENAKISVGFLFVDSDNRMVVLYSDSKTKMGYKFDSVKVGNLRCPHCFDVDAILLGNPYEFAIRSANMKDVDVDIEVTVLPQGPRPPSGAKKSKTKKYNDVPCVWLGGQSRS